LDYYRQRFAVSNGGAGTGTSISPQREDNVCPRHPVVSARRSFVTFPLWKKHEPLRPSGLLGPVTLRFPLKLTGD
jgi:hypothetical protein